MSTDRSGPAAAHLPVMVPEVLRVLDVRPGGSYVDGTVGLGGHAEAILEAAPGGRLFGLDQDPSALEAARVRLARFGSGAVLAHGNFRDLESHARSAGFEAVDGVLLDLGVSSMQLDTPERGFSFQGDYALDMRMDPTSDLTADDIVNTWDEEELANVIWRYGEERRSRSIARAIVARRPVRGTRDLVNAIEQAVGRGRERQIHPATLTFQALRIAVNQELDSLEDALPQAHGLLDGAGARLAVISFHSLEDRMVKDYFRLESTDCVCPPRTPQCVCGHVATLRLVTRRAMRPGPAEVAANPRSRSAKLRAAEALGAQAA